MEKKTVLWLWRYIAVCVDPYFFEYVDQSVPMRTRTDGPNRNARNPDLNNHYVTSDIFQPNMCRWIVYAGTEPVNLGDLIMRPAVSLISQSFSAVWHPGFSNQNNAVLNADGFGVGWYNETGPFVFKSVHPAWSDANLAELKDYIQSLMIFAHVRAASPGSIVSHENCHPFKFGRLMFMHKYFFTHSLSTVS